MKPSLSRLLRASFASVALFISLVPLRPTPLQAEPSRPIRVLFLGHEGKHHNSGAYLPLLQEALSPEAIEFDYFTRPDCLTPETLKGYDAVMLYANHGRMAPEQFEALQSFIQGGHGFLPIHCASACFGNDPRFIALVGGRFLRHGSGVFSPSIVEPGHPILKGVAPYETWDETYVHANLNEQGRTLLMERVEGDLREPWSWVRQEGAGRVFYTASGHDERTWSNASFQKMLGNAIVWAVGDTVKAQWEASRAVQAKEARPGTTNPSSVQKLP